MKKIILSLFALALILFIKPAHAQTSADYKGAEATLPHYKAVYYLDQAEPKNVEHILRNMDNALEDERLKGKVEIELVVFGDGVALYQKSSTYEQQLLDLQKKGVILTMCSNTMKSRNIAKDSLFPFIGYVPSANGELIIRQAQGWVAVRP